MKQFAEFLPIAVFAGVYFYTRDIFLSTGVLMVAMLFQVGFEYLTTRGVTRQTQFIFWSVVILGGMTLAFRDEAFIQWKPTIVNWVFCLALFGSQFLGRENLLKKMLGHQIHLPTEVWRNLTVGWSAGFFIAGALNLMVAYNFSMDTWVSYKLIGGFGLTFFYIIVTMIYLVKGGHMEEAEPKSKPADL